MKNLKSIILLAFFICFQSQASREQQSEELGKCYRADVPVLIIYGKITDQGNEVQFVRYENQSYRANGVYTSNVALKNHVDGSIAGNWVVALRLDDPKPLTWISSNMNFSLYDPNSEQIFHEERLDCRDAGM